jgi:hypothetical protein
MIKITMILMSLMSLTGWAQDMTGPTIISCGQIHDISSHSLSFRVILKKASTVSENGQLRKVRKLTHEVRFTGIDTNSIFKKTELFRAAIQGTQFQSKFICLSSRVVDNYPNNFLKLEIQNEYGHGATINDAYADLVRKL